MSDQSDLFVCDLDVDLPFPCNEVVAKGKAVRF